MAAEDQDSRTEDPTSKRQAEAARKGNVGISREVSFAGALLVMIVITTIVLPWSVKPLVLLLTTFVEHPEQFPLESHADIVAVGSRIGSAFILTMGPVMALFAVTGVVAVVAQQGRILWAYERMGFQWDLINPMRGFSRIYSGRALVEWAKGLAKLLLISALTFMVIRPDFAAMNQYVGIEPMQVLGLFIAAVRRLLIAVALGIAAIAVIDVFYQRWSTHRSIMMTRQEVKDEHKNADGDPTIKAKYRARRQARARRRMMQAVPTASVVVTNPTHYAVALSYQPGMNAPKLVAKGMDFLAARIRELAEENGIPIIENPPIARALFAAVEVDDEVPPEHYKAVAEIIGYVMRLGKQRRAG